ncbi:MAG: tetrathionate reductase family octaheme c-type cytochrome [Bacteroidales bacterium]|nr:tetrathionate reductase family octaheme c-type cytochrome [Bacteroidales bacterium]
MKRIIYVILVLIVPQLIVYTLITRFDINLGSDESEEIELVNYTKKADKVIRKVVDHAKFEVLQQEFERPQDVTLACLSCHTERHHEIMANNHWTWDRSEKLANRDSVVVVGKKNIINNFCIGIGGSEKTCSRCHIGYGWEDKSFDFSKEENIDCLVCHDQSGTYVKAKGAAGYPAVGLDLNLISQSVGSPKRENCGVCHYWGGGGNNVKHGDLDDAMNSCSREVDVHMAIDGEDMSCVECHKTENHAIPGKVYALSSEDKNRVTCVQCHTEAPHTDKLLNDHFQRIACQTCHIPEYAKANATKMVWDWSTAGRLDEHGNTIHESDADGNHNYLSIKGTFVYDDHVVPEYYWFNGLADHLLITDSITETPVQMNTLEGSYNDKGANCSTGSCSKIWPVKVHRGKQPYDVVSKKIVQPKLWSPNKGDSAYWTDFDWDNSIEAGMKYVGLPYSGKYDFVETEMYWPLNHQVSPADKSLQCTSCHSSSPDSRLANLKDFYLPGRDRFKMIDYAGIFLVLFALLGVIIHGGIRIVLRKNCLHDNK